MDLVMNSNFRRDGHRSPTFPVKKNEIIYFYMFNSIIGYKGVTYKTEIHSFELKHLNLLSKC